MDLDYVELRDWLRMSFILRVLWISSQQHFFLSFVSFFASKIMLENPKQFGFATMDWQLAIAKHLFSKTKTPHICRNIFITHCSERVLKFVDSCMLHVVFVDTITVNTYYFFSTN